MMKKIFVLCICLAALLAAASCKKVPTSAGKMPHALRFQYLQLPTTSYIGVSDTALDQSNPGDDYGSCDTAGIGVNAAGNVYRAVFRFDLSQVPTDAQVTGANLVLFVSTGTNTNTLNAYAITSTWVQGTHCGGTAAIANQASWSNPWATAGGDFGNTLTSSGAYFDVALLGPAITLYFDPAVVQQWVSYPATNKGFIVIAEDEINTAYPGYIAVWTSEAANAQARPKFMVSYLK
jgi:hypothetical protein